MYGAEAWTLRRSEQKQLEAFEIWIWKRMERVKWTDKIKNAVVLERVGEGRIMLELIRKNKINWLGHWLRRNCLLKDALEHGCANHATEGETLQSPFRCCDVTNAPYLFSCELCSSSCTVNACLCTRCAVGGQSVFLCAQNT